MKPKPFADGGETERPQSPVPDWLRSQQERVRSPDYVPEGGGGVAGPLGFLGELGMREGEGALEKAKGAAEATMGAMPALSLVRGAAAIPRALYGSVPRAL